MLELLGNLLDNAAKWAKRRVRLSLRWKGSLRIIVEVAASGIAATRKKAPAPAWQPGPASRSRVRFLEAEAFLRGVQTLDSLNLDDRLAGLFRGDTLLFGQNCRGRDTTDGEGDCSDLTWYFSGWDLC